MAQLAFELLTSIREARMFHGLGQKLNDRPIGDANIAGNAIRFAHVEDEGVGTAPAPAGGLQRFPTEPPPSEERASVASHAWNWSGSALGFVAGVAAVALWRRLR